MIQIVTIIFATLVVAEFGTHVVYHAVTGKAGLNDRPFAYLEDIFYHLRRENKHAKRVCQMLDDHES